MVVLRGFWPRAAVSVTPWLGAGKADPRAGVDGFRRAQPIIQIAAQDGLTPGLDPGGNPS